MERLEKREVPTHIQLQKSPINDQTTYKQANNNKEHRKLKKKKKKGKERKKNTRKNKIKKPKK
jgi:hypothetical protein